VPEINSLKFRNDFKNVAIKGKRVYGKLLSLCYYEAGNDTPRFGFTVKKK